MMKYLTFACATLLLATSAALADKLPDITQISPKRSSETSPSITVGEDFVLLLPNESQLTMIWCEPGSFLMGSPEGEVGRGGGGERKPHEVSLTQGFWLGQFEVTVEQYHAVDGNASDQRQSKNNDLPISNIQYVQAKSYGKDLTKLFKRQIPKGYAFALPTEAQREYACRAGTTTALNSGKDIVSPKGKCPNLNEVAWYKQNSDGVAHPIGKKKPNAWGFYDMHGNVSEWCLDTLFDKHFTDTKTIDPVGDGGFFDRQVRGGNYMSEPAWCRSTHRWKDYAAVAATNEMIGFRIALTSKKIVPRGFFKQLKDSFE